MHATLKFHKRAKKKLSLIKIFHKKHGWSVTVPNRRSESKSVRESPARVATSFGGSPTAPTMNGWSVPDAFSVTSKKTPPGRSIRER
jgi:hypothetical protein